MTSIRIAELAFLIKENTFKVDEYMRRNGLPSPTFDEDGPVDFKIQSREIQEARAIAIDSTLELHQLLLGPALCLRPVLNGTSLQAIYRYDIASKIPIHGEVSFKELAHKCGLNEIHLRRFLRFAMVWHRVFQEPRKGIVAHTAASRKLVEDPLARAGLGYMFDEVWQSFAQTFEAMDTFQSDEPNKTGWNLSQHTEKPTWEYYASHPEMASRFAASMSLFSDSIGASPSFLVQGYPWSSIGDGRGTIVDVGGSRGFQCVAIAQSFPDLHFVVQDLPDMIDGAKNALPTNVESRISFMEHDFFTEQPVSADIYLFRIIFHNWSDANVIKILKATVPAMQSGARVVVNDYLILEPGILPPIREREVRAMDMIMLSLFNSREREKEDWQSIFQQADARFTNVKVWVPEGATLAIIEATLE
ncbi:MAG: hypothetical protein ALECFALPRED_003076 [Alectoria fallacina]|uniref:O-methyltransferase C-terminal domain-containing protein n=1 Tax=Alectoria fallacina TaxID=1903189 RepID=A0A8H3EQK5_9LECA|nr:MAG: hypothetical protein ALECFALPRED_003076 [Alectoria fallacina]